VLPGVPPPHAPAHPVRTQRQQQQQPPPPRCSAEEQGEGGKGVGPGEAGPVGHARRAVRGWVPMAASTAPSRWAGPVDESSGAPRARRCPGRRSPGGSLWRPLRTLPRPEMDARLARNSHPAAARLAKPAAESPPPSSARSSTNRDPATRTLLLPEAKMPAPREPARPPGTPPGTPPGYTSHRPGSTQSQGSVLSWEVPSNVAWLHA